MDRRLRWAGVGLAVISLFCGPFGWFAAPASIWVNLKVLRAQPDRLVWVPALSIATTIVGVTLSLFAVAGR
jgi:hypothetical protein